jgi:hypothetical protein
MNLGEYVPVRARGLLCYQVLRVFSETEIWRAFLFIQTFRAKNEAGVQPSQIQKINNSRAQRKQSNNPDSLLVACRGFVCFTH